jgi:hypothetical protein
MALVASNGRIAGTSPFIVISAEDLNLTAVHNVPNIRIDGINPPDIANGNSVSPAAQTYVQLWSDWNYSKVTEPKFDGIADKLGVFSNQPDFIKDYHFIGLMRNVDAYLRPMFFSNIMVAAHMPSPIPPPTPPTTGP